MTNGTYLKKGRGQPKGNQFFIFITLNKLYGVHLESSLLCNYSSKDAVSQSYFILWHSFAQLHPLLFLLYSVVSRFSKWQLVCENLSYKNELWILFQILSPCSTVKLLIIVEKISIISEFSFFVMITMTHVHQIYY